MATVRLREIQRTTATQAVCDQLIALIESEDLGVGDRLPSENDLARSLGVSRPVVREALERLRALGLVVSQSGRGSFIASKTGRGPLLLGRYSARDLHDVRCLLEIPGAGIAAVARTEANVENLRRAIARLEKCDNPEEWVTLDAQFHVRLAEAAHNEVHALIVSYLRDLLVQQSIAASRRPGRTRSANREHRKIYEAVSAGNKHAAERAMAIHLASGRASWESSEAPPYRGFRVPNPA